MNPGESGNSWQPLATGWVIFLKCDSASLGCRTVDGEKPPKQIDWVRIKSMKVEDRYLRVVYDGGREIVYKFKSKLELLKFLENRRDRE